MLLQNRLLKLHTFLANIVEFFFLFKRRITLYLFLLILCFLLMLIHFSLGHIFQSSFQCLADDRPFPKITTSYLFNGLTWYIAMCEVNRGRTDGLVLRTVAHDGMLYHELSFSSYYGLDYRVVEIVVRRIVDAVNTVNAPELWRFFDCRLAETRLLAVTTDLLTWLVFSKIGRTPLMSGRHY